MISRASFHSSGPRQAIPNAILTGMPRGVRPVGKPFLSSRSAKLSASLPYTPGISATNSSPPMR